MSKIVLAIEIAVYLAWLGFGLFAYIKSKRSTAITMLIAVLITIGAIVAGIVSNSINPSTEEITLTAMGQAPAGAGACEVFLTGYTVDGKEYLPGLSLNVTEGKWFWCGESYCWRPESDYRRPDGLTQSVTIEIPVGSERQLHFQKGNWWGDVEIRQKDETTVVSTYSEEDGIFSFNLHPSNTSSIFFAGFCRILIYLAVVSVLSFASVLIVNSELINRVKGKRRGIALYICIALITGFIMIIWSDRWSAWADEILQIACSNGGVIEAIKYCLKMIDASPPLFSVLFAIWYRIAPYGHKILYIFPVLLSAGSIVLVGKAGERIKNIYFGTIVAVFMATLHVLWIYCGFEIRPYPMLVFSSSLALYLYIKRNEDLSTKNAVLFSCGLAALAMSHYFGCLACAMFFASDFYLWVRKRLKLREFVATYVIPGVTIILWVAAIYIVTIRNTALSAIASWYPIPKISDVKEILRFLTGYFDGSYYALMLGIALIFVGIACSTGKNEFSWSKYHRAFCVFMILGCIGIIAFYGNFVNTASTMWHPRYFIVLLPYISIVATEGISSVSYLVPDKEGKRQVLATMCVFTSLVLTINCLITVPTIPVGMHKQPYREAADWIYTQRNWIFNDDTLVIATVSGVATEGWDDYYITRKGRRDNINVCSQAELTPERIRLAYKVYIQYSHVPVRGNWQEILDQEYVLEEDRSDIQVRVYTRK